MEAKTAEAMYGQDLDELLDALDDFENRQRLEEEKSRVLQHKANAANRRAGKKVSMSALGFNTALDMHPTAWLLCKALGRSELRFQDLHCIDRSSPSESILALSDLKLLKPCRPPTAKGFAYNC